MSVELGAAVDVDSALAVAESIRAEHEYRRAPLAPGQRLDVNSVDERDLDRLPGVGPALARAVVETRREIGGFRDLAELEQVPGFGSSRVSRVAPYITLAPNAGVSSSGGWSFGGARPRSGQAPVRVDVNRASIEELERLPGIGPTKAAAIKRWRQERGRFASLEDLLQVPGIGPATLRQLSPLVRFGP